MKTITFLIISCFVLLTTLSAKAEINYVPNVVHGFSIVGDIKQHRAECKSHSGTWNYKVRQFCQTPKLDVALAVRPTEISFTELLIGENKYASINIIYHLYNENLSFHEYVENIWLEYLHQTYGEPRSIHCNDNNNCSWYWFLKYPVLDIISFYSFNYSIYIHITKQIK